MRPYNAIYRQAAADDRALAFEQYWAYLVARDGAMEEETQSLEHKTVYYRHIQTDPVRAEQPLTPLHTVAEISEQLAHQDPLRIDRRLVALTVIYQFACHESAGIAAAWTSTSPWARCTTLQDKITRYHLCEEFCHLRLFAAMFQVFHLRVEWPSLAWPHRLIYGGFTHLPEWLLAPVALSSEVMGIVFYRHIRTVLEDVFATEPTASAHVLELLGEIMVDELGHVGERRSYLGDVGVKLARWCLPLLMRGFFHNIPTAPLILDISQMIRDAVAFDYSGIDAAILERAWIPGFCRTTA